MERLYRLFQKASVLGSLINPRAAEGDLLVADFHELQPLLEQALAQESQDDIAYEMAVTARGLAKAAEILAGQFTLVATNVPYLGRGKQPARSNPNDPEELADYCQRVHPDAKADLAACFVERCLSFCAESSSTALVTPQSWFFQNTYSKLRKRLLEGMEWNLIGRLGTRAFETISGEVVNVVMPVITRRRVTKAHALRGVDASAAQTSDQKAKVLRDAGIASLCQLAQLSNPDSTVTLHAIDATKLLGSCASQVHGLTTGDMNRLSVCFWEIAQLNAKWSLFQSTLEETAEYGGRSLVLAWSNENPSLVADIPGFRPDGRAAWGRRGVAISRVGALFTSIYDGAYFSHLLPVLVPKNPMHLDALWAFCSSDAFSKTVRDTNPSLSVDGGYLLKVPFDLAHWQKVAAEKYPHGLPKPFSSDPTQWLFNGHPADADQPLHVAVARLLGYQWPRQTGSSFPDCPALEPDGLETLADEDGIVCLSAVRGEASAVDRLRRLLATALGEEWSSSKERELLLATAVENNAKKSEPDLENWLRSSFFSEHCKLFQSRPFIWQIWDGHPQGFSALVNYHKLAAPNCQGRKTLEQLTFTYLGDWIDRQKLDQAEGVNGADDRLAAALDLQGQLKKILEGEPPFDIFVRWKPLHQQAIGWDPNINHGVRLNIRPFLSAQLRKGGKTGAGILRAKPGTIKWAKDRGKEPMRSKADFPWFWGWDENSPAMATDFGAPVSGAPPAGDSFDGNRWNDLHYTRPAKEAARARHRGEA